MHSLEHQRFGEIHWSGGSFGSRSTRRAIVGLSLLLILSPDVVCINSVTAVVQSVKSALTVIVVGTPIVECSIYFHCGSNVHGPPLLPSFGTFNNVIIDTDFL